MPDDLREREYELQTEIKREIDVIKHDVERVEKLEIELEQVEEHEHHIYKLIVNRIDKEWPERYIKGRQILELAGSPPDWIVNELVPGGGEDPEIGLDQSVDLSLDAEPCGVKRFLTRKPKTNPGASRLTL